MTRASHRIVGVVELEPGTGLVPFDVVDQAVTPLSRFTQASLENAPRQSVRSCESRQRVLADVSHLQRDLDREFNRYLATA